MPNNAIRAAMAAVLVAFCAVALAQSGVARDGSRPSDGAINGGSILPGETGGVPGIGGGSKTPADAGNKRCNELTGTLREQCLLQEQGASTGGSSQADSSTRTPDTGESRPATPRIAPPPQNPR
jgi:hypothetical protein